LKYPLIIGWDIAGEIESVGSKVEDRGVGERVVALIPQGGYAELAVASSKAVVPLPDNVSFDEAAALPVAYLTAWYALRRRARLRAGEVALIQAGASGVGVAGIQIARNRRATVIATAGSEDKVAFCTKILGAHHAINYRQQDFVQEVQHITHGEGANVVLESVGGETLVKSLDVLAQFGRLVSVGNSSRQRATMDATAFLGKRGQMEGFSLLVQPDLPKELANLVQEVSKGRVKAIIDKTVPLSEAAAAHRYVGDRLNIGKVILHP
jgi:NADPH2:quinone reductase